MLKSWQNKQTVRDHPVYKQNYGKEGRVVRLFVLVLYVGQSRTKEA